MTDRKELAQRIDEDELSHIICGAIGACNCPGEWGANPDTATCWRVARAIIAAAPPHIGDECRLPLADLVKRLRDEARYAELANNAAMGHVVYPLEHYQAWKDADLIEAALTTVQPGDGARGKTGEVKKLDLAWEKINAIGGTAGEYDDFGKGINHAVEQALFIIEELGGQDPLRCRVEGNWSGQPPHTGGE